MSLTLRGSLTSPYTRLARAAALTRGLGDRLHLDVISPWESGHGLEADNPLGKVPTLVVDDAAVPGGTLYDSRVICEYLDTLGSAEPLFPAAGDERFAALRLLALGIGLCDLTVDRFLDSQRPEPKQNPSFQERRADAINRTADWLEGEAAATHMAATTIGTLAVAVALDYVDLRAGDLNWRHDRPALTAWARHRHAHPALAESAPPTG